MVMFRLRIALLIGVVTLTLVAVFGLGRPASAHEDTPPDFEAGVACEFSLDIR